MTTIAYHHESKTMAWDSRRTVNGLITSDSAQKQVTRSGVMFWMTGCICDFELFISMYFGEKSDIVPECEALIWDGKSLFFSGVSGECIFWKEAIDCNFAIGSGQVFAYAAMDFNCNAVDAVEYAKTRDCYTGGRVNSHTLG